MYSVTIFSASAWQKHLFASILSCVIRAAELALYDLAVNINASSHAEPSVNDFRGIVVRFSKGVYVKGVFKNSGSAVSCVRSRYGGRISVYSTREIAAVGTTEQSCHRVTSRKAIACHGGACDNSPAVTLGDTRGGRGASRRAQQPWPPFQAYWLATMRY